MNLSSANLAKLRSQPHRTIPYLSIYKPKTILAAQVTGTYNKGETEIDFYNVSTGSYLNAYPNMQVLVGSAPGESDRGRIRMRAITGSYSVMAENNILWENGDYLTFIDYINVEAIFPRIIQNPNNAEDVIFYKDWDIPYSNQNSVYGTFPNAGSHRAGFLETGTVSFYFTATGTVNVNGSAITHSWAFEGGTPTGSTALTPGLVAWQAPGHYKVRYISTAGGVSDTTYRYVSVYDRPENGVNTPILKWQLQDFSGNRSEGGYIGRFKVWQDLGSIEPNALVVLFTDDWYGGEKISLGGNGQNNSTIFFVGYILKDSIQFNYKEGFAEFDVGSATEVMKLSEGFAISCESKVTPATWFQLQEMTTRKALYHYLKWHSTVLDTTDFQYIGDDRLVQYFDTDRQSLYDAVNSFVSEGLIGEVVSDRQGKIWSEISPVGYENPMSSIPAGMTIQKQDWIGEPNISERRVNDTSFIEMGGVVYNGAQTNTFQALLTNAPSFTPFYRGKSEKPHEGLILLSQSQLNQLSGNYLAARNSQFEDVSLSAKGNYRNLDIAPQERMFLLINENDTVIRKSTIGYPFRLMTMNWLYNADKELMYPELVFEQIATGTAGRTLIIPAEPPTDGYDYPGFNLPPLPDFNIGIPPIAEQTSTVVLAFDDNKGMIYTKTFDAASPDWIIWNAGIDLADQLVTDRYFFITPNGAVWILIYGRAIYRAPSLGSMFVKIADSAWLTANYPNSQFDGPAGSRFIMSLGYNPLAPEEVAFVAGGNQFAAFVAEVNFWTWNQGTLTKRVRVDNVNVFLGSLTYDTVNEKWVLTGEQFTFFATWDTRLWRFNRLGTSKEFEVATDSAGAALVNYSVRARDSGMLWLYNIFSGQMYLTQDNGTNIVPVGDLKQNGGSLFSYAVDPTGQFMMGNWDTGQRGKSGDYGYSWAGLPTLPFGNNYVFAYAGGEGTQSRWIAARGVVRASYDYGNTWINKEGNLLQIAPVPLITGIFAWVIVETTQ